MTFTTTDARQWFHRRGCGRSKREPQTNDWLLRNKPHLPTEPCLQCGKPVAQYRARRNENELRYCSTECRPRPDPLKAIAWRASWPPVTTNGASVVIPAGCIDCGTGRRLGRCSKHHNQIYSLRQQLRTRLKWLLPRTCDRCGDVWKGWGSLAQFCRECARARYLLERVKRRAKIKTGDNTISLQRLWERDEGTCYLCGDRTDLPSVWYGWNSRAHWMPKAPTIDHIKALANGGTHTWDNVALAHNCCNSEKSDTL